MKRPRKRKWTVALPVVPVLAWVLLAPPWDFSKNHSAFNHQGRMIYAREDLNGGVTTVLDSGAGRNLYSNALFQAGTGLVAEDQARFALMPLLHVQGFERALVIGVGSGQTAGVLGQFPFRSLDLVDYSPGILEAAQRFFPQSNFGIFNDPRVKVHVADGRHYLLTHAEKLDLLTLEVTRLWVAGEGDLYTRQFYEICAARLRDRGVLQQWVPLFSLTVPDALILLRTVREVFPHVALYIGVESGFLVASRSPLAVEVTRLQEIESEPRLRMLLHSLGLSRAANLLGDCALVPESLDRLLAETEDRRISTDLWPHLEYSTAYYSVGNPTTGQMRRFFLRDREFQLPSIRGADVAELAEIQREALEERIRQIPVPK